MTLKTIVKNYIESQLLEELKECNLDGASFDIIKDILEKKGYVLSSSNNEIDDVLDTNGWQVDYYQYIFKDNVYTGYVLEGSMYFGDHEIKKWDEIY